MTGEAIWLVGAGGHGKVVIATLEAAGMPTAGVFDADPKKAGSSILGRRVEGMPDPKWWIAQERSAFLSVGMNDKRAALARLLPARWATLIHPTAVVHSSVAIGPGTLICAGAIIQPEARIGSHVIVNTGAVVEHDCRIGDFCHLGPGSRCAGGVTIGPMAFLGVGAIVIPSIEIGGETVVGAGAVVIRSVPAHSVVAGVPARRIAGKGGRT